MRCVGRWAQARGGGGPVAALLGRARGERAGEGAGLARWLGRGEGKGALGWADFWVWAGFGFPISLVFLSFLFQTHSN